MTNQIDTNMSDDLRIGSRVFIFDPNRRVYERAADGRHAGAPIFSKCFIEVEITAETPRKWKTPSGDAFKKNPYETGFLTAQMVESKIWEKANRYKIIDKLHHASFEQLRAVAKIMDYEA